MGKHTSLGHAARNILETARKNIQAVPRPGTKDRTEIKNVARPEDSRFGEEPTRQQQIQKKIIDESFKSGDKVKLKGKGLATGQYIGNTRVVKKVEKTRGVTYLHFHKTPGHSDNGTADEYDKVNEAADDQIIDEVYSPVGTMADMLDFHQGHKKGPEKDANGKPKKKHWQDDPDYYWDSGTHRYELRKEQSDQPEVEDQDDDKDCECKDKKKDKKGKTKVDINPEVDNNIFASHEEEGELVEKKVCVQWAEKPVKKKTKSYKDWEKFFNKEEVLQEISYKLRQRYKRANIKDQNRLKKAPEGGADYERKLARKLRNRKRGYQDAIDRDLGYKAAPNEEAELNEVDLIKIQYQNQSGQWITARQVNADPNDLYINMRNLQQTLKDHRIRAIGPHGELLDLWGPNMETDIPYKSADTPVRVVESSGRSVVSQVKKYFQRGMRTPTDYAAHKWGQDQDKTFKKKNLKPSEFYDYMDRTDHYKRFINKKLDKKYGFSEETLHELSKKLLDVVKEKGKSEKSRLQAKDRIEGRYFAKPAKDDPLRQYSGVRNIKKYHPEETQLDELKKATVLDYATQAIPDMKYREMNKEYRKSDNRGKGLERAVHRLTGIYKAKKQKKVAPKEAGMEYKKYHSEETEKSKDREIGTKNLAKTYADDTPGQQIDEVSKEWLKRSFNSMYVRARYGKGDGPPEYKKHDKYLNLIGAKLDQIKKTGSSVINKKKANEEALDETSVKKAYAHNAQAAVDLKTASDPDTIRKRKRGLKLSAKIINRDRFKRGYNIPNPDTKKEGKKDG